MEDKARLEGLISQYEKLLKSGQPIYLDAGDFEILAENYIFNEDIDKAEEVADRGLSMHPNNYELTLIQAKIFICREQYKDALFTLNSLGVDGLDECELNENDIEFYLLKIEALINLGQEDEARVIVKTILGGLNDNQISHYFITEVGLIYNDTEHYEEVVDFLSRSYSVSKNKDLLPELSYAYEMLEDLDKAIEYNQFLLKEDPYSVVAWMNVAKLYTMTGEYAQAVEALDFVIAIDDSSFDAYQKKAACLYLNDDFDESIDVYLECLRRWPNEISILEGLFDTYVLEERFDEGLELLEKMEKLLPQATIICKRAHVYMSKGEIVKAKEELDRLGEEDRDSGPYYELMGEIAYKEKNYIESRDLLLNSLNYVEDNVFVFARLTDIFYSLDDIDKAEEYAYKLYEKDPSSSINAVRLALFRFERGKDENVITILEDLEDSEVMALANIIIDDSEKDFSKMNRDELEQYLESLYHKRQIYRNMKF